MADVQQATKATEADPNGKPKKKTADALNYGDSTTLAKPKKVDTLPSVVRGGGGPGGASDIRRAFDAIVGERDEWFLVAEGVGNPGRFYDGFRALGASVKINRRGEVEAADKAGVPVVVPAYDIFAMVPKGELKPHKKGTGTKRQEIQDKMRLNREAGEKTPEHGGKR